MRIEFDLKLSFQDVLIRPKRSTLTSRKDVELVREYTFCNSKQSWSGIPIISSNMDTTGTFEIALEFQKHQVMTCIHKYYSLDDWVKYLPSLNPNYFAVSSGINPPDIEKLDSILKLEDSIRFICLDVANGYSEFFVSVVKEVRSKYPDKIIIAGNVVTGEMTEELLLAGADIVKIGIGSGNACLTRMKTGIGYPQLSAVIECADAAHGLGGHIISDGGCKLAGDVAKAFGGGSDFVMIGSMFSAHDESGGEIIEEDGKKYKLFYGMSSDTAMIKYVGKVNEYRASEGRTIKKEYKGPIRNTILDILGGLRSACTYVGAKKLKGFSKRTTFIKIGSKTQA